VLGDVILKKTNSGLLFTCSYAPDTLMLFVRSTLTTGISQLQLYIITLCVTAICFVLWSRILESFSICGRFPVTL